MPMVTPPEPFVRLGRLDETRELLYVLLSDIHEGTVSSSELRGRLVNQLIHWHKIATNKEMSDLFNDMRLLKDLRFAEKFRTQKQRELPDVTPKEVSDRIKTVIKAYISIITKRIEQ